MLARDLITRPPVEIARGRRLSEAARQMEERNVGSVVVVDDGEPVGILTDRDIALHMAAGVDDAPVDDLMTSKPVCVRGNVDVEYCLDKMEEHCVRRMLVLEDSDELQGVVSLDDILLHLSSELATAAALIRGELLPR